MSKIDLPGDLETFSVVYDEEVRNLAISVFLRRTEAAVGNLSRDQFKAGKPKLLERYFDLTPEQQDAVREYYGRF